MKASDIPDGLFLAAVSATATRDGRWWLIEVPGIGATQSRTLADADDQAIDLIAAVKDVEPGTVSVEIVPGSQRTATT